MPPTAFLNRLLPRVKLLTRVAQIRSTFPTSLDGSVAGVEWAREVAGMPALGIRRNAGWRDHLGRL
jgi:hypothetical protein